MAARTHRHPGKDGSTAFLAAATNEIRFIASTTGYMKCPRDQDFIVLLITAI
jgi:hypothetical protein